MEQVEKILNGSNALYVLSATIILILIVSLLSKIGLFSFVGKGFKIGHTERQARALILKQANFMTALGEKKVEEMLLFAKSKGLELDFFKTDYVMAKMINQTFIWLICNDITDTQDYIDLKTVEAENIVLKTIARVNHTLLENEDMFKYFKGACREITEEIVHGLVKIKKMEGF